MADLNEQAKNIGRKIRLYTTKENYIDHSEINDNPTHWRKQDFIAQVLFNAQEQKYYAPNIEALEQIKEEFVNATKTEISLDNLFEKEWLRTVTDVVHIPAAIRGSISTVKKVKACKNEMLFLRAIKDEKENLTISELEQLTSQYEKENSVVLDIEKALEAHLLSTDNDKVKINNITYYNPIIDNWNEFQFLAFFYDAIYGEHSNLIISKDKLTSLHSEHTKKYALTPALAEMLSLGLAKDTSDGYVISLFTNYCSDDTLDEAGAILWRKLNDAYKDKSPDQLLILWFRKIIIKANHNIEIYKYFSIGEKDQFNRAAVDVIMNEVDLEASPTEYKKAFLDYYMGRDVMSLQFAERFIDGEFTKDCKDAFDTMKAISKVQRGTTDDYLYFAQSSREVISYLVGQVVKSHSCEDFRIDRINDLCANIHHKPYLLWTLCFWIWEWRPELIPALMKHTSISSALFLISRKITITKDILESSSEIKNKTASILFNHLLDILQSNLQVSQEQKAKIVFNCLLTVTTPQFQIKGQVSKLQRETQEDAVKLADHIRHEFANRPNQNPVYDRHIRTSEKYYPQLLKDLFVLVSDLTPEDKYSNGVLDFHYEKFSLLLFLSQLSRDIPAINHQLKIPTYDVALAMLDCYTKTISATSIAALDYDTWKSKEVVPIFLPAFQNIEAIDWATLYMSLEEENLSSQFLHPANLTSNDSEDEYDKFNRFLIGKLRNHLKVLIVTYKQLQDREVKLRKRGILISSSLVRLQNVLLDIVISFSFNEPTKKRFDIFNRFDERPTFDNRQNELIPELGNVSNYFPVVERQRLINALLRTDIFVRILKLTESMTSEQDQKLLSTYLKAQNIQEELANIHSVNDFQFLLSSLSVHLHFQDIAKEVLTYWETKIVPRKRDFLSNEIIVTTYRTKLLQAFQANDFQAIEEVQEPEGDIYINATRLYPLNEKDFYKALYYFKNDKPEEAYSLYNDLVYRKDDDTTTIALNRFASKLKWANKEIDTTKKNILITEALDQWDNYLKDLPSDISLEHIAENMLYNRLVALDALERYDEFDRFYSGLNYIERVKSGFLQVGVQNRLTRKMKPEATSLIKEATEFHRLKDGSIPDFITEMSNLVVNNNDDPETFKNFFNTLLSANPNTLVKLIPDSINDGNDLNSYLLNFIVDAASGMLSNINSIAEISYEDKYSDLIIMGLNALMKIHHWHTSTDRGAFSDSKHNNPGEIDFAIYASNNKQLAVCEALNLNGENNYEVAKHSTKIFNYTPSKNGLFLLVYYQGPEKNFLTSWGKYKNSIQNNVKFPESYQFVKESFIDLSEKYKIAAIRVGSSSHGEGIILHHVFININYKATTENMN